MTKRKYMSKTQFYSLIIRACKINNYRSCYRRLVKIIGKYYMLDRGGITSRDVLEAILPVYEVCVPQQKSLGEILRGICRDFNSQYGPDGLDTTKIDDTVVVSIIHLIAGSVLADYPDFLPPLWYRLNYGKVTK